MSFASVLLDGILAIWVICWPITAKKWGPTYMAQQSLLILLYLVITNQLRRFLTLFLRGKTAKSIFGLLKLVLIVNLIFQPFISILVPESVAYFYSLILLLLEPYIIWLETKLVLEYIYRSGRWVGNLVFDICEENVLVKVGVLTASTMIYICSCVLLYKGVIQVQSHFFAWFALALVIIHTLAGIASYIALDGVITNSALVFLTSAAGFYIASLATVMKRLDEASEDAPRQMVAGQVSIYQQLNYLITIAADETVTQQIFPRTPKTSGIIWIVSLIRVIAFVTWISNSLTTSRGSGGGWKSARGEEEENLDETNENFSQDACVIRYFSLAGGTQQAACPRPPNFSCGNWARRRGLQKDLSRGGGLLDIRLIHSGPGDCGKLQFNAAPSTSTTLHSLSIHLFFDILGLLLNFFLPLLQPGQIVEKQKVIFN